MGTLHRYLLKESIATILVAVGVCTGLLLLGNLLKEIVGLLMSGQATLGLVAKGVGLLLPFVFAYALPMGALTAALLVFGRLSADQELTAARANGISLMALAMPVVLLSLVLCGVCAWINLDLAPRCRAAYGNLFKAFATQKSQALIPVGRFVTEFPNFVIYADRIEDNHLEDVLFLQLRDGRKVVDIRAPRAELAYEPNTRELRLSFLEGRYLQWVPGKALEAVPTPVEPQAPTPEPVSPDRPEPDTEATPGSGVPPESGEIPPAGPPPEPVPAVDAGPVATEAPTIPEVGRIASNGPPASTAVAGPTGVSSAGTNSPAKASPAGGSVAGGSDGEEEEGFWQRIPSRELRVSMTLPAEVFSAGMPRLSNMTFRQLLQERRELTRLGIEDLTPLDLQLHRQAAFSFACFGFALVGIPLGVRAHRRETSVGIAFAIVLVLVYYAFLIVAQAFETRAEYAPWLIVWMPNLLFQVAGAWLMWRVNRGR